MAERCCAVVSIDATWDNEAEATTDAQQTMRMLNKALVEIDVRRALLTERMPRICISGVATTMLDPTGVQPRGLLEGVAYALHQLELVLMAALGTSD